MTPPKILSPAEALRALADGDKLQFAASTSGRYFYLKGDSIYWDDGRPMSSVHKLTDVIRYTESDPELACKSILKLADTLIRVAKETEEKTEAVE